MFSLFTFNQLYSLEEREDYASSELKKLGWGSSRSAYKLNAKTVLKVAVTEAGIEQNRVEAASGWNRFDICAKTLDASENYEWIVQELCKKATFKNIQNILGLPGAPERTLIAVYELACFYRGSGMYTRGAEALVEVAKSNPTTAAFIKMLEKWSREAKPDYYTLEELQGPENWGLAKRGAMTLPVIIDYGCNNGVFDNFYRDEVENFA